MKIMAMGRMIHESSEMQAYSVGEGGGLLFATTDELSPVVCSLNDGSRMFEMVDVTSSNAGSGTTNQQTFEMFELFQNEDGTTRKGTEPTAVSFDRMEPGTKLATARFQQDGEEEDATAHPFTIQMLGVTDMGFVLGHAGSSCEVSYQTHAHHELNRWMLPKPEVDTR